MAGDLHGRFQFLAWQKVRAILQPVLLILRGMNAVTAAAHLRRSFGRKPRWIHDAPVTLFPEVQRIAPTRVRIQADVLGCGTMTGFARNAQFRHARIEGNGIRLLPWLAGGGMTVDATHIPNLIPAQDLWIFQEDASA